MIKQLGDDPQTCGFVITKSSMPMYRMILLQSQLKSEIAGLRWRQSAYAMIKHEFGLKGNRQKVLDQFNKIVERAKLDHAVVQAVELGEEELRKSELETVQ